MRSNNWQVPLHRASRIFFAALCLLLPYTARLFAEDLSGQVKKAVEKSTLDQPGTKPFHLKATFAPSFDRDKGSNRVGEIEMWWQSPTEWRRELRSPEFHQIAIQDGDKHWEKNDGDYFPDWLRELAQAIIRPVPLETDVLSKRVKTAEVRHFRDLQTNINWDPTTGFDNEQANGKGYVALADKTGLLFYTGGPGFGGQYHDFKDFHGRMIAHTVASGYVEVTAKLSIFEDLGATPDGFFDATVPGGNAPIDTVVLSEQDLRKNLLPGKPFVWPALTDGPLEGVVWTEVVLDRTGKIREMIPPISDNPGLKDAAEAGFKSMQFQPILRNGIPVQAMGRISVSFKTVRPAGVETFDSARNYFERGRKASFLAAGSTAPYTLHAEFQVNTASGLQTGRYEDTWISATQWKREAWLGSSHLVKSQDGEDKHYVLAEGPESSMLRMVMQLLEPIPAADTMTESDWRIRRDITNGEKTIRVSRGPDGADGQPDPAKSEAFWFDDSGHLLRCYTAGLELRFLNPDNYNGVQVARQIAVLKDGKLGMRITIKEIGTADQAAAKGFKLKGHEWQRAFTAEER